MIPRRAPSLAAAAAVWNSILARLNSIAPTTNNSNRGAVKANSTVVIPRRSRCGQLVRQIMALTHDSGEESDFCEMRRASWKTLSEVHRH
jgi:hypothetical protein